MNTQKAHITRFIKYIFVGGSAALVNWAVFFTTQILSLHYLLGGLVSFVIATLWNFIFAKKFIFRDSKHHIFKEGALIYLASFVGLLLDLGVLFVCVEYLHIDEMPSKVISTGVAFIFNFSIRNFVIYKH